MEIEQSPGPEIPNKLYFRIGEVSKLLGVEAYVLRYWESEFPGLAPKKSDTGQRLFRRKDVEFLLQIKHLLYEKKFTIEGARQWLLDRRKAPAPAPPPAQQGLFGSEAIPLIREELQSILELLK